MRGLEELICAGVADALGFCKGVRNVCIGEAGCCVWGIDELEDLVCEDGGVLDGAVAALAAYGVELRQR